MLLQVGHLLIKFLFGDLPVNELISQAFNWSSKAASSFAFSLAVSPFFLIVQAIRRRSKKKARIVPNSWTAIEINYASTSLLPK